MQILKIVFFIFLIFFYSSSFSENKNIIKSEYAFKKNNVILLPLQDFRINIEELFYENEEEKRKSSGIGEEIENYIISRLKKEPEIEIYGGSSLKVLQKNVARVQEFAIIARGYLHLGLDQYRNLRIKEAIESIKKSEDVGQLAYLEIFEPELFAEIKLHLGIMNLELKNEGLAHTQLMEMFFYEPQKRIRKNYFGEIIEKALRSSLQDFIYNYEKLSPLFKPNKIGKFFDDFNIKSVIYVYLTKKDGKDLGHFMIFEKEKGSFIINETFSISDGEDIKENLDRFITKWLTCTKLESRIKKEKRIAKLYFDIAGSHSIYLKYPTRRFFNNVGFALALSYTTVKNIDLFTKFSLQTSISDKYRDLYENFNNIRFAIGPGFSITKNVFKIYWYVGPEIQYIGNFEALLDPDCKFFGKEDPFCDKNSISSLEDHLLVGGTSLLGFNLKIYENLYTALKVSISAYFIPFARVIPLNFPITFEAGVGYMF